ncbi:MAG TPA: S8 family serine peptidase, partial [Candidatus Acidoferrum sp.]|nr:S8 family serine peptidase [Candidatus Acidoferrum sp.]
SAAWAAAVNAAYDAGICIVAAAGNNFSAFGTGFPTRLIVYPARFRRVLAACGVMADRRPYFGLPRGKMQGCWGPPSKMRTALAAFTPNMPWAERGASRIVDMNGAGTSSATPQIAGAAALYIAHHRAALARFRHGWQRVEAVRQALFASADKSADGGSNAKLGNGILRASAALALAPSDSVTMTPPDSASLSLLKLLHLFGAAPAGAPGLESMLALEAAQLAQIPPVEGEPNPFEEAIEDPDRGPEEVPHPKLERFLVALREHPMASPKLKERMSEALGALGEVQARRPSGNGARGGAGASANGNRPRAAATPRETPTIANPPVRRLAGYAFDPSVAQRLATRDIGTMTFRLPWEKLRPGPVGEYLEVIDHDPTNRCFYDPVNLDDPHLLARDGLAPSERTPQFHQQMVYAVAQLTIVHFEQALGRKVLWAPGPPPPGTSPKNDSYYVPRLRVYPHALRDANAYYSPSRKALLFGYFRANPQDPGEHLPGAMVFTCLSHDIVAHETAHALLDGMHRKFTQASNPDVLAFHEGFADIVALLLHFTFPEILRDQLARTRGSLREETLLGSLAMEFGTASGSRGALRDYIGERDPATGEWRPREPHPGDHDTALEPHARGGILVAAVFEAFRSIYEKRTRDLIRLATGGSGMLPPGSLPPDLVARLASEAAKTAEHVLHMCIRGLDYCPPCDITFGEYLRAVITADVDLVPDDDLGYRASFIDAFRRRAIYPRDVASLSEESLVWRSPEADELRPSPALLDILAGLRVKAQAHLEETGREALFYAARGLRRGLHDDLVALLQGPTREADGECLGLEPPAGAGKFEFEVHAARFANRIGPDGQRVGQCVIELLQDRPLDDAGPGGERFQGGTTVIVELGGGPCGARVRYLIRKRLASETRRARQRDYRGLRFQNDLWGTYFGESTVGMRDAEPFAFVHRR